MKEARPWKQVFWRTIFQSMRRRAILAERIAGAKPLTDVYLAALARRRGGRLVTFNTGIPWQAVGGGSAEVMEVPSV